MSAFSDAQSVFRRMGQTPCSLTARKYKVVGTTGLLFDFTTVSHKTLGARKKHKIFVTINYRHHLQMKLLLLCYSVKLLSDSKCLTIRST